jgi:hypothetical protein
MQVISATSYTVPVLPSINKNAVPFELTWKSISGEKSVHASTLYSGTGFSTKFVVARVKKTASEGPTVQKPAPFLEDYDEKADDFLRFLDSLESEDESEEERRLMWQLSNKSIRLTKEDSWKS